MKNYENTIMFALVGLGYGFLIPSAVEGYSYPLGSYLKDFFYVLSMPSFARQCI
jgi:hypothetical protein